MRGNALYDLFWSSLLRCGCVSLAICSYGTILFATQKTESTQHTPIHCACRCIWEASRIVQAPACRSVSIWSAKFWQVISIIYRMNAARQTVILVGVQVSTWRCSRYHVFCTSNQRIQGVMGTLLLHTRQGWRIHCSPVHCTCVSGLRLGHDRDHHFQRSICLSLPGPVL